MHTGRITCHDFTDQRCADHSYNGRSNPFLEDEMPATEKLTQAALRLALSDQPGKTIAMHPDTKRALFTELERDGHLVPNEDPDAAELIGGRYVATDAHLVEGAFVLVDP